MVETCSTQTALEAGVPRGARGDPGGFCARACVILSSEVYGVFAIPIHSGSTSMSVGSWFCHTSLAKVSTFPSSNFSILNYRTTYCKPQSTHVFIYGSSKQYIIGVHLLNIFQASIFNQDKVNVLALSFNSNNNSGKYERGGSSVQDAASINLCHSGLSGWWQIGGVTYRLQLLSG